MSKIKTAVIFSIIFSGVLFFAKSSLAATYYVKNGGNDNAAGTSDATAWATIAKVSGFTFAAGDSVLFKRGSLWREELDIPWTNYAAAPITFSAYGSGDLPKIYGSNQVSGWIQEGNLYYASWASNPTAIWFINTDGTIFWGTFESAKGSLTSEYKWWWDSDHSRIYVYVATSPDTRYTSVEAPVRKYGIFFDERDHVTISYFEVAFAGHPTVQPDGIFGGLGFNDGAIIEHNKVHHIGRLLVGDQQGDGIDIRGSDNAIIRYNEVYQNARRGISFWSTNGYTGNDGIIERNTVYNNHHAGIDIFLAADSGSSIDNIQIRGNYIYLDSSFAQGLDSLVTSHGIYLMGNSNAITNAKIYNNIVINMYGDGLYTLSAYVNGVELYHNVAFGSYPGSLWSPGFDVRTTAVTNVTLKNNIGMDCVYGCLNVAVSSSVIASDYNLWYQSGGTNAYAIIGGTSYYSGDFELYKSATTAWRPGISHDLWQDPLFQSAGSDFRLTLSSPARNAGVTIASVASDYDGVSRPQPAGGAYDIGAYEFIEVSDVTPPAAPSGVIVN